jgi:UDP-glucose 4-epimerase
MSKILVTGGTGFIGSHTVVELIKSGFQVVIIDNFSNSHQSILSGIEAISGVKPSFYQADCSNKDSLLKIFSEHPDIVAVIHFAAFKAVKESIDKPLAYYRNNLLSLVSLLEAMSESGVNNLVFSSSCAIYGEEVLPPFSEQMTMTAATSPYGRTKQMCENIISDYAVFNNQFKNISLRYFNPIGAHPSGLIGELPLGVPNNLIPFITQTAIGIRNELLVYGNDYPTPDGTAMRDYIDVVDLANAHLMALNRVLDNQSKEQVEFFNLGQGRGVSVKEIINTFERVNSIRLNWKFAPRRLGDLPILYADTSKAGNILGWKAQVSIANSLENAWRWEKNIRNL